MKIDNKKPLNFYANTKNLAEQFIIENTDKYLIIRSIFWMGNILQTII